MLIRPADLARIRDGEIDLAFRRWERPRLLVGTRMRTSVGLVEVTSVDEVDDISEDDAAPGRSASRAAAEADGGARRRRRSGGWVCGTPARTHGWPCATTATSAPRSGSTWWRGSTGSTAPRRSGPWTREALALIAANPARRAPDLAAELGRETAPFKRDVRKLKELGLTESLEIGYRLSPRGRLLAGSTLADARSAVRLSRDSSGSVQP